MICDQSIFDTVLMEAILPKAFPNSLSDVTADASMPLSEAATEDMLCASPDTSTLDNPLNDCVSVLMLVVIRLRDDNELFMSFNGVTSSLLIAVSKSVSADVAFFRASTPVADSPCMTIFSVSTVPSIKACQLLPLVLIAFL